MVIKGSIRLIVLASILSVIKLPIVDTTTASHDVNEQEMRKFLTEIFEVDVYDNYGFTTDDVEQMSFGEPIAIYHIPSSFAFGESDEVIQGDAEEWMAVVFENDRPINGMKLKKNDSNELDVVGFGYPLTLAADVVQMDSQELLLYEFQTGYYYAFNQEKNTIKLLEEEVNSLDSETLPKDLSLKEFQLLLAERYADMETNEERENNQLIWLYIAIGAGLLLLAVILSWRKIREN